ncbi:hypothetical protein INT47_001321 [Mucor saturninus]|uniref:Uncharacterized protein n=1 Tax=Mucor saturninus TaxID=64648 RepID=A0A8H7QNJ9_9FUNG|nr:hypothetical protein INT47_001321 [Mucor saturninus]
MGKVQKKTDDEKKRVSKFANAELDDPKNAKERIEQELQLLHVRKQTITTKKTLTVHKVKKGTTKKAVSAMKQKKIARALMVADKEEKRLETAASRAEKRKMGKNLWE